MINLTLQARGELRHMISSHMMLERAALVFYLFLCMYCDLSILLPSLEPPGRFNIIPCLLGGGRPSSELEVRSYQN